MFYRYAVTIAAETTEADPSITYMDLAPGELHQVEIGFPWGCAGLVHVQIWRGEHQVWPTNPGESFAWNDYNVVFSESEQCAGATEHWSIRAWNDDVRHDHNLVVRVGILDQKKTTLGRVAYALFGTPRG